ncbi:hypothetical protein EV175_006259 [Coemansia sp. RSA 1933]|nr:hypothetical protein EV175_006259 [Coemansia sp. RSA 1933]
MDSSKAYRFLAALLCVAINAAPGIAEQLVGACSTTIEGACKDVVGVLKSHGGDRFGERDNTDDLAVLETWLGEMLGESDGVGGGGGGETASCLFELVDALWLRLGLDPGFVQRIDTMDGGGQYSGTQQFKEDLGRRWTERPYGSSIPSVLIVRGPVPASVLLGITVLDFYGHLDADTKRVRKKELEKAHRQFDEAEAVLASIGVPSVAASGAEIAESLRAINRWAASPRAEILAQIRPASSSSPAHSTSATNSFAMLAQENMWQSIAKRTDRLKALAQKRRTGAERSERYVLRAFVADSASIVRRFGKGSSGTSHYSVMKGGICQPVRAQDIEGTVTESMWVCCSDDSECRGSADDPDGSQGGLNTVVADPDDEIFCRLCSDPESWGYNQIIICDGCDLGVHQMCHAPIVTESDLTREQWYCSNCTRTDKGTTRGGDPKRQRTD